MKDTEGTGTHEMYNQEVKNRFPDSDNDEDEPVIEDADSENDLDFYHRSQQSKEDQTFE